MAKRVAMMMTAIAVALLGVADVSGAERLERAERVLAPTPELAAKAAAPPTAGAVEVTISACGVAAVPNGCENPQMWDEPVPLTVLDNDLAQLWISLEIEVDNPDPYTWSIEKISGSSNCPDSTFGGSSGGGTGMTVPLCLFEPVGPMAVTYEITIEGDSIPLTTLKRGHEVCTVEPDTPNSLLCVS